jgi:hypothetical protein
VKIEVSELIDRPPEVVFQFIGAEHVQNHPRWDPAMELELLTPGPLGVGSIVRRRHTRAGAPTDGAMEVVEYDAPHAIAVVIQDGPVAMYGRQLVEALDDGRSRLTIRVHIPGNPNPMDPMPIATTVANIKALIESER